MDVTNIITGEFSQDRSAHSSNEVAVLDGGIKPTKETYEQLQQAYERLNSGLFAGELPNCLITLQRRKGTYGYFAHARFGREDGLAADEIALNPAHFRERSAAEVLSTLAHEMVHLWQHHFGKPGRGRYHNREWAAKMKEIGLQPTDTGAEGGKETGDRVTHLIVPDGRFDKLAGKLLARGFVITWAEQPQETAAGTKAGKEGGKSGKRVKYVCPHPHEGERDQTFKAWAKHGAALMCGRHAVAMEPAA